MALWLPWAPEASVWLVRTLLADEIAAFHPEHDAATIIVDAAHALGRLGQEAPRDADARAYRLVSRLVEALSRVEDCATGRRWLQVVKSGVDSVQHHLAPRNVSQLSAETLPSLLEDAASALLGLCSLVWRGASGGPDRASGLQFGVARALATVADCSATASASTPLEVSAPLLPLPVLVLIVREIGLNAIKYARGQARLTYGILEDGGATWLWIDEPWEGAPDSLVPRIRDIRLRMRSAPAIEQGGGRGLPLLKMLARACGGELEVELIENRCRWTLLLSNRDEPSYREEWR